MNGRTAEEVLRWALRIFIRQSPWQHTGPQMTSSALVKDSFSWRSSRICRTGESHRPLAGAPVCAVRFYCQGKTYVQDVVKSKQGNTMRRPETRSSQGEIFSDKPIKNMPFYEHLNECRSPLEVLDLAGRSTSTDRRVSNCLSRCWVTSKKMSDNHLQDELRLMFEHPGFEDLLQKTMKNARRLRPEDLTHSLLAIVKLGVPQRSRVVQTLLRVCQENLNELDEKSLSVLITCLQHMESSPNGDALKDGVRLIIEAKLPRIRSVMVLQTMMRHVGQDASVDLKKKMERKALSLVGQFTLPNSQYMVTTLASMGLCSKPLLDVCSKNIAAQVHGIPFNRLLNVLRACKELQYRDLDLFTAVSDYVGSSIAMWNNRQVILLLSAFEDLAFCPTAMLDAFAERLVGDAKALGFKDVLSVLKIYSSINHDLQGNRVLFLESMTQVVESYLPKMDAFNLLKVVYYLCLLNYFPQAPLEQLLEQDTLDQIAVQGGRLQKGMEKKLQVVALCLRLDQASRPNPLTIPSEALGSSAPSDLVVNPGFSLILQSITQGWLLEEAVVVQDLYFIDGVLTMSDGEASLPEHRQRIAVFCAPASSFCYGTSRPRGNLAVKIRHLKVLGYIPVVFSKQELDNLSEEERNEFVRSQVFPELERIADVKLETEGVKCDS
ncbi:FAST kinase domain-containing protein 2, mitochondrial [Esox lucius]|uniref:RAP domain-containing protein n=1 Tax=Esox lucius TaxID=8010 RepID=A0A3P9AJV3_ESOLU|nr:FAST kinase domain-containing protein 2, mitochondrial [Esox lucius]XP_010891421.1 FAST kinase domain-containing protein 2, mitochondrial [Esox lucius]